MIASSRIVERNEMTFSDVAQGAAKVRFMVSGTYDRRAAPKGKAPDVSAASYRLTFRANEARKLRKVVQFGDPN